MPIEEPRQWAQAQIFTECASKMRQVRYHRSEILEDQLASLEALADVVTEVAYHFDRLHILEPAAMQAYRQASRLQMLWVIPTSAQMLLALPLAQAINNLKMLRDL